MPTLKPPPSDLQVVKLPKPLQDYLDFPAPEGTRNEALKNAAMQARDARWSEHETMRLLGPLATARDGLPENEAKATIHSMFTRAPRDVPRGTFTGSASAFASGTPFKKPPAKVIPKKEIVINAEFVLPDEIAGSALIEMMFRPGERIMIASAVYDPEKNKETVSRDLQEVWDRDALIEQMKLYKNDTSRFFETEFTDGINRGVFFCINPLGSESDRRITENIADFRHVLVEFDQIPNGSFDEAGKPVMVDIPKEKQFQIIQQSGAPVVGIIDSGNRSLHAIMKANARDSAEHRDRAYAYVEFFKEHGVDEATKDSTRFSRLPGATRFDSGGRQRLLSLKIGADSYEAWMSELAVLGTQMPELMRIEDLLSFVSVDDPDRLIGANRFLGKATSFLVSGHSGIGKSSLSLQMIICWAVGRPFLPREDGTGGLEAIRPIKTLIVQSENDLGDMAEAMQGIVTGLALTPVEIELMKKNIQIRRDTSHTGNEFIEMLQNLFNLFKADLILCDPLFAVVGQDISKAEVIGDFFRRGLNTFMQVTNCIMMFAHHIPKPSVDPKHIRQGYDDIYSGAGSAELVNWARATATLKPMNGYFQLVFGKRAKRTGILSDEGDVTNCLELQHGEKGIFWERLDKGLKEELDEKASEAAKKLRKTDKPDAGLFIDNAKKKKFEEFIRVTPGASKTAITKEGMRIFNNSGPTMKKIITSFLESGELKEIDTGIKAGQHTTKNFIWVGKDEVGKGG